MEKNFNDFAGRVMCGFSVLISDKNVNVGPHIGKMNNVISHRGPDDEGFAFVNDGVLRLVSDAPDGKGQVAFGHRRLSILDLSHAGHQPMASSDKKFVIVFNGEVYNFLELRDVLSGMGYVFHSNTDTEVVLNAYREWGTNCLSKFNGMFSFVVYDFQRKKIFIARDRFGVKPLYYWYSDIGFLAVCSEIKQFTTLPGWRASLNHQRAYDFLHWGVNDHTDETLFEGVKQLQGGHFIELDINSRFNNPVVEKWYELKPKETCSSFDESSKDLFDLFMDSIRLRLRSDVPIGTGLSGGLDSSSIVCAANESLKQANAKEIQYVFSACAHDKRFDEREYINEIVGITNAKPCYIFPDHNELFSELSKITWHQDEPFHSTSIFAEWSVFKAIAKTPVKVTLDGHGADELLAGYHVFFGPYLSSLLSKREYRFLRDEIHELNKLHGYNVKYLFKQILNTMLPESILQPIRRLGGKKTPEASWINANELHYKETNPFIMHRSKPGNIYELSTSQILETSLPVQLHWSDRDSMAHSVEARTPYLDYRIVEMILGFPDSYKIKKGVTKVIQRAAFKNLLPQKILSRNDKMGFVTPEEVWVREGDPGKFINYVKKAVDCSNGVLNDEVIQISKRMVSGDLPYDRQFWRWISYGEWLDVFNVKN